MFVSIGCIECYVCYVLVCICLSVCTFLSIWARVFVSACVHLPVHVCICAAKVEFKARYKIFSVLLTISLNMAKYSVAPKNVCKDSRLFPAFCVPPNAMF